MKLNSPDQRRFRICAKSGFGGREVNCRATRIITACSVQSEYVSGREPSAKLVCLINVLQETPNLSENAILLGAFDSPQEAAESAGLRYISDDQPGVRRQKRGKGFTYSLPNGERVRSPDTLARIRKLAIPPAYTEVWICPKPDGHIQATGRDAKGRKQYRYHMLFREIRDGSKFDHMLDFARVLPAIRARIDSDLALRGLPREKVLATIVQLLESTLIRVGNAHYAKQNKSFGLTTLRNRHVAVTGDQLRFQFKGKSGKQWRLNIRDRRIAKIVRAIQELPGQQLFQYSDADGVLREISSGDINDYLRAISGSDITAKDFRTWTGTVSAAIILSGFESAVSKTEAQRNLRTAIETVSAQLGNTPTICRKCYVHPDILNGYLDRSLTAETLKAVRSKRKQRIGMLSVEEASVLHFLETRKSEVKPL